MVKLSRLFHDKIYLVAMLWTLAMKLLTCKTTTQDKRDKRAPVILVDLSGVVVTDNSRIFQVIFLNNVPRFRQVTLNEIVDHSAIVTQKIQQMYCSNGTKAK